MASIVDIAGAAAPAASRPGLSGDAGADGAARSANAACKAKVHGARTSKTARTEADAGDAFGVQLDAALPGTADAGEAEHKTPARSAAPAAGNDPGEDEQSPDQVSGAVLAPWMLVQPVEIAPVATGRMEPVPSSAQSDNTVRPAGAPAGAGSVTAELPTTDGDGMELAEVRGTAPPAPQESTAAPSTPASPDVRRSAPERVAAETSAASAATPGALGVNGAGAPVSAAAPSVAAAETPAPAPGAGYELLMDTPGLPAATVERRTDVSDAAAAAPMPATPISTDAAEPAGPLRLPAIAEQSLEPSQSPAAAAVGAPASTEHTAADAPQDSVDFDAAAVAPAIPRADVRTSAARNGSIVVKGRGGVVQAQHRHDSRPAASSGSPKAERASALDASANVAWIDDQRRDGSAGDADTPAGKGTGVTTGLDSPSHEAPPAAAARAIQQATQTMPTMEAGKQLQVNATPLSSDASSASTGDVPDPDTPHHLVQSLRMQFLRGGGDAIVQLRPEHLGQVTVSLRVEQGSVAARITAADPVVAEWLQAHQESLREGLQANGLTLDRLSIDRDGRSPERRERREPPPRQRFRQASEPQSTFELTI